MESETPREFRGEGVAGLRGALRLRLEDDRLVLDPESGAAAIGVPRSAARDRILLRDPAPGGPVLHVKSDRKIVARIERDAARSYMEWRGPLTEPELRSALRRQLGWAIPIGVLWVIGSAFTLLDPRPAEDRFASNLLGLGLGVWLLLLVGFRVFLPSRHIFLQDGLWFLGLGAHVTAGVLGGDSPWWLALVPLVLFSATLSLCEFRRFPPDDELAPE